MKDEWTDAYSMIMPMLGLAVAAAGLTLTLLQMQRSQAVSGLEPPAGVDVDVPKVRYSEGDVFVEVRNPGEWWGMREFVQPNNPYLDNAIMGALSG